MSGELCRLPLLIRRPIIRHSSQLRGLGVRLGTVPLAGVRLTVSRNRRFLLLTVIRLGRISGMVHDLTLFNRPFCVSRRFSVKGRGGFLGPLKMQPSAAIVHKAGGTLFTGGRRLGGIRGKPPRLPFFHSGFGICWRLTI